jgi:hypothetical protein
LDKYDKPVECDYRPAIVLFYSGRIPLNFFTAGVLYLTLFLSFKDDKHSAGKKRDEIIKERKSSLVNDSYPKARRSLNFQSDKTAEKRPLNNGDTVQVALSSEEV